MKEVLTSSRDVIKMGAMSDIDDICQKLEAMVRATGNVPAGATDFNFDTDLFDYGYLDSFGIVELIAAIDKEFGIDVSNEDFYRDLRTIRAIAERLASRVKAA